MKTKEQILQEHVDKDQLDTLGENVWPDILEAMEIYRNQLSGEGVKSPEDYILYAQNACAIEKGYDNFETLSLAASIGRGTFGKVHVDWAYVIGASIKEALTAQARDYEREQKEIAVEFFSYWYHNELSGNTEKAFDEWIVKFRNDRSKPKE